jgi:hypothetical protein
MFIHIYILGKGSCCMRSKLLVTVVATITVVATMTMLSVRVSITPVKAEINCSIQGTTSTCVGGAGSNDGSFSGGGGDRAVQNFGDGSLFVSGGGGGKFQGNDSNPPSQGGGGMHVVCDASGTCSRVGGVSCEVSGKCSP